MKSRYKIGILTFALIVPVIIFAVILGIMGSQKAKVTAEYEVRKKRNLANQRAEQASAGIKAQIAKYSDKQDQWDNLLSDSDVGVVAGLLKEISGEYAGTGKFRQNDFKFVNKEAGVGAASKQASVTYTLSLSGTFQALQESMLTLESKMPNLSLNSISLSPQEKSRLLDANLTYTAWNN